jgi:alkylated DNA repair dioxygenase AlkB
MISLESLGFKIIPNFLSEKEEREILSHLTLSKKVSGETRSSIKRYGSNIPYKNQIVSDKIPEYLEHISKKIFAQGLLKEIPDSISINEYQTGNAIAPHIDSLSSGPIITIVSLLSDAVMVFSNNNQHISRLVPARSLVQFSGPLRFDWEHSIEPVESTRFSIVFRSGKKSV